MKRHLLSGFIFIISFLIGTSLMAQGYHHGDDNYRPDSLVTIIVTGSVSVDSTGIQHVNYFLDEGSDGTVDYHLNFGPYWYQPDSSDAVRPAAGDTVAITGGLHESLYDSVDVIVVYEIDGEFWRNPLDPNWNQMGDLQHHRNFGHGSFAFGMMNDSLETVELTGTALVDSTMIFAQYYLDVDADTIPDYHLNFGPPWYEPESGAVRPATGDSITIVGGLYEHPQFSVVIVYEINGDVWRDSTAFGQQFAGGWILRHMDDSVRVRSTFDHQDWIEIHPGWHLGMGHMMSDSLFVQMVELYPWNMPAASGGVTFAGYELAAFNNRGMNRLQSQMGFGGHIGMGNQARIQFHYTNQQMAQFGASGLGKTAMPLDESQIQVMAWNEETGTWTAVSNVTVDTESNLVTFESSDMSSNYVLTTTSTTTSSDPEDLGIQQFTLAQNYPNPFNPRTTIGFTLPRDADVSLAIFDLTGRQIVELVNKHVGEGYHEVQWNSTNAHGGHVPSGVYFYRLKVNDGHAESSAVKKLVLLQ